MHRLRAAAAVLSLAALCGVYGAALAGAQPSESADVAREPRTGRALSRDESALALGLAKIGVNEAGIATVHPAEIALIWQTVEARGDTARERLGWLRGHSSCVLGESGTRSGVRPGNCAWSRNLRDSDAEPEGWSERYPHLRWSRYALRWRQIRELSRRLIAGEIVMRPCPVAPLTWGSAEDTPRALRRGLVMIDCRDESGRPTRNRGFVRRVR